MIWDKTTKFGEYWWPFERRKGKQMVDTFGLSKTLDYVFHGFYFDFDLKKDREIHASLN